MYIKHLVVFVVLLIAVVNCEDEAVNNSENEIENTIILNDSNFDEVLKTNNFFVMFFAPW